MPRSALARRWPSFPSVLGLATQSQQVLWVLGQCAESVVRPPGAFVADLSQLLLARTLEGQGLVHLCEQVRGVHSVCLCCGLVS